MKKFLFLVLIIGILCINVSSALWESSSVAGYYNLDEVSGTVLDQLGLNNGVNNLATTGVTGKLNTAYEFNGVNSSVNITDDATLNFSTINFSISLWIKPYSFILNSGIFTKGTGSDDILEVSTNTDGSLRFHFTTNTDGYDYIDSNYNLTADEWNNIVVTWNGSAQNLYINGTLDNFKFVSEGEYNGSVTDLWFGKDIGSIYFNGTIDEVGIWNRSLTQTEITDLYNGGSGLAYGTTFNRATLTYPTNAKTLSTDGEYFNVTYNISDSDPHGYEWINSTYLVWNITDGITLFNETTVSLSGTDATSSLYIDSFELSNFSWNVYACYGNLTFKDCVYADNGNFTFNIIPFSLIAESYNNQTMEGSTEVFAANFSFLTGYRLSSTYLVYNDTLYPASFTEYETNKFYTTKSIVIPKVDAIVNATFYWYSILENDFSQNTTSHNQTINNFVIDNCASYTNEIFNFTMVDEDSQIFLNGADENTSIKVSIEIFSNKDTISVLNYSVLFNETNPARICMESELNDSSYSLGGVIEYSSSGRFVEFYHFQNYTLNNDSVGEDIYLYNLNSTRGQEFKIIYKDSNFLPVSGALLYLQRKYIDEGVYKVIEIPKTGTEGYTMAHLIKNDAIYNIIIYKDGQVLASFNDVVADCQNPLISSCQINLNSYLSSTIVDDFTNLKDISFTLTYDEDTRKVTSIYTIPTGLSSAVSLNVTLFDTLGNSTVCEDLLISSGGTLNCDVPTSFGNATVIAQLYKDNIMIGYAVIKLQKDPRDIYGDNIIFIAIFGFAIMLGVGLLFDNPMAMGIVLILSALGLIALNIIHSPSVVGTGATILWLIISIIIVLIKGGGRQ